MKYRFTASFVALVAVSALTQLLFAQRGQRTQAPQASTAALPFYPHDISGIWKNPGGFDVALGPERPPMTAWGKEQWSKTRASARNSPLAFGFYKDQKDWNDPLFQCDPSGYPRNLDYSNYRFVKLPDEYVEFFERDHVWRDLWTDGRKLPGPDAKPRWYGYATAYWDGDTLVVESSGYDDRTWVDPYGSIHSDQMHLEERYKRLDQDTLEFSLTLTDPKAYTGSWGGKKLKRSEERRVGKEWRNGGGAWQGKVRKEEERD